ncbi:hypothetical protein DICPUDRAFT_154498 [Dictyostelium purpureum]|uniref:Carrier domain-containing protein n=1 Tax=Dictyostelium purpureum TaxID=5786 RepID=F0ZRH5_DICPU|nr:uncharacterized protein DICPUDRAFT_154498 [Dictyostelium purpureum]EGC33443.1 hypothetical protein DICPUDRAFT_154498 [Dictyostelium purpureum]|eukprot:XP_003290014.1 hypothetical protein DICPUDRAFT_154498 [Dictyostelium purpureum]
MDVKDTVLNMISSEVFIPKESIRIESTLGDNGAAPDMVEIKSKLDRHYEMNIPIDVMHGKISGIISCIEKKKHILH